MPAFDEAFHRRLLEVREVLMYSFDVEVLPQPMPGAAFEVPSRWLPSFRVADAHCTVVARDALTGVFALFEPTVSDHSCSVHVDTQGHAVVLGACFQDTVRLVLELPYWRELLLQSSGELTKMRSVARQLEDEISAEFPAIPAARADLLGHLALPKCEDPVLSLYQQAVQAVPCAVVLSPHGWQYQSLV